MRFVALNTDVDGYKKYRNYWEYLKAKMKRENNQLGSVTTQFSAQRGYGELVEFLVFSVLSVCSVVRFLSTAYQGRE